MRNKRKEQLTEFHRAAILAEAGKLFVKNGIGKTTVDEIAKQAGYSKSTLYVYFNGKDAIVHHLLRDCLARIRDKIAEASEMEPGFTGFFLRYCRILLRFHDETPVYFRALSGRILNFPEDGVDREVVEELAAIGESINDCIAGRIKQGIREGAVRRGVKPMEAHFILWSNLFGLIGMVSAKSEYVALRLGKEREVFLEQGFRTLLRQIATGRKEEDR